MSRRDNLLQQILLVGNYHLILYDYFIMVKSVSGVFDEPFDMAHIRRDSLIRDENGRKMFTVQR